MPDVRRQRGAAPASCARLQVGNFLRTLATPEPINHWSLTSLNEKLIKIGAKVVSHGRYVALQRYGVPRGSIGLVDNGGRAKSSSTFPPRKYSQLALPRAEDRCTL
jgi:hypothetical protein